MKVVILVGLVGSGKSTFAEKMEIEGYKIINQDILGSRDKCLDMMESYLIRGKDIVVDRTNINKKQRLYFTSLAQYYGAEIECINLIVDPKECLRRINDRNNHPTISVNMPIDKKRSIIEQFQKSYERPELEEGFTRVIFQKA